MFSNRLKVKALKPTSNNTSIERSINAALEIGRDGETDGERDRMMKSRVLEEARVKETNNKARAPVRERYSDRF